MMRVSIFFTLNLSPLFIEEPTIEISRGRNPILELIMNDAQYVPNDTNLEVTGQQCLQ